MAKIVFKPQNQGQILLFPCFQTKLTIAFLLIFVLFWVGAVQGQDQDSKPTVSLNIYQKPISSALAQITQQTGIRFSYNSLLIDVNKTISIHFENQPIDKVLSLILPAQVGYRQVGKYIILSVPESKGKTGKNTGISKFPVQLEKSSSEKSDKTHNTTYRENSADTFFIQKNYLLNNGISIDSCHRVVTSINIEDMNKKLALFALGISLAGTQVQAQIGEKINVEKNQTEAVKTIIKKKRAFQATFVYPIGTDGVNSSGNEYNTSFNIIGGRTGKIEGFEIAGIFNLNKYSSSGVQIAGVANLTGNIKNNYEASKNVQIAGITNYTRNGVSTQITGVGNFADNSNLQLAGITNVTKANSKVQIAGIANMADTLNIQISGIVNRAYSSSCQISAVNITKKGGFQLGVINVRDTADGISIGLINIVKKGGLMEWEASGNDILHTTFSFRSGTRKLYTVISAGYNYSDNFYAAGAGFGTEITLKNKWQLSIEGIHYNLNKDFEEEDYNGLVQIRPAVKYEFGKHFKIIVGPVLNLSIVSPNNLKLTVPYSIWKTASEKYNKQLNTWVGFSAGVRF